MEINIKNMGDLFYCPFCGEHTLEVYMKNSPWFFSCINCGKTIFMTDKKIFDEMNKELEETYKKEKEMAVKTAFKKASLKEENKD